MIRANQFAPVNLLGLLATEPSMLVDHRGHHKHKFVARHVCNAAPKLLLQKLGACFCELIRNRKKKLGGGHATQLFWQGAGEAKKGSDLLPVFRTNLNEDSVLVGLDGHTKIDKCFGDASRHLDAKTASNDQTFWH